MDEKNANTSDMIRDAPISISLLFSFLPLFLSLSICFSLREKQGFGTPFRQEVVLAVSQTLPGYSGRLMDVSMLERPLSALPLTA